MPESIIAYKVLRNLDGRLISYWIGIPDEFTIIYEENKLIYPIIKNSPIFIYETLESAIENLEGIINYSTQVWKVEANFPIYIKKMLSPLLTNYKLESYWNSLDSFSKMTRDECAMNRGALVCKSLKLIERIR